MSKATAAGPPRSRIGLRERLVFAFLTMAVLIAVSGGAGLVFVSRVGDGVAILADTAAPLLQQSSGLMANAERMRQVLRDAIAAKDPATARTSLANLTREAQEGLARLRALARQIGAGLDVEAVASGQAALLRHTSAAIEQDARRDAAAASAGERFERFEAARAALQTLFGETAGVFEQGMVAAEEAAKVQVQTGQASVDSLEHGVRRHHDRGVPGIPGRLSADPRRGAA